VVNRGKNANGAWSVFLREGSSSAAQNDLKLTEEQARRVATRNVLFARSAALEAEPHFVSSGRAKTIEEATRFFEDNRDGKRPVLVRLSGLGGIGKTAVARFLAVEMCKRLRTRFVLFSSSLTAVLTCTCLSAGKRMPFFWS
jgi:DNA replication protein DnaC